MAIMFEQNKWFHIVPTDGRKLDLAKLTPTWMGTSVGSLGWGHAGGRNGRHQRQNLDRHRRASAQRCADRGRAMDRVDYSHLRHQVTITDTKYLTKPMANTQILVLMKPGDEL